MSPPLYELQGVANGQQPTAGFAERTAFFMKCQFASTMLFWTCLWLVKGSFLALFRRLTCELDGPRKYWWAITVFTVLAYTGSMITYPVSCTSFEAGDCRNTLNVKRQLFSLRFSTGMNIATDVMIIVLPIWLTSGLNLSLRQKLGLIGCLGLGIVVAVFAVVRIILTNEEGQQPEITWLAFWSVVESSIAVVVGCLASFKVLLTRRQSRSYGGIGNSPGQGSGPYYASKYADGTPKHGSIARSGTRSKNAEEREMDELPERPMGNANANIGHAEDCTVGIPRRCVIAEVHFEVVQKASRRDLELAGRDLRTFG